MPVIGGYKPQRLQLMAMKPAGVVKAPPGAALYGTLTFGGEAFSLATIGDRLYVDANGNGDLTDDPATEWSGVPYKGSDQKDYTRMSGGFSLVHPRFKEPMHFGAYVFDPNDTGRAALKDVLLFYTDYALTGSLAFGGESLKVYLIDWDGKGDFAAPSVQVIVDRDGNGRGDSRFELYDLAKPLNIGGTTYEFDVANIGRRQLGLKKSSLTVAEIPAPPNLNPGQKAPAFEVEATDGTKIKFPGTYKGKLVMLDFWATWCGPCIAELPNVTKAYSQYHDRGFEILGISLDQADKLDVLNKFCGENNMPWRQVYDGKFWEARIAKMYGIQAIPAVLLVDGDTGEILADARTLRGEAIFKTIEAALTKKFGK
jgi:peroxiredoxin